MAEYNPNTDVYTEVIEAELSENYTFISDIKLEEKTATQNGIVTPSAGKDGLSKVTVAVPNTYTAEDEGKVVDDGALVAQTSTTKIANGTYDTTLNDEVVVNVPNSYSQADEGKVVSNGALVAQTAHATVTQNGTIDTTLNNSVTVNVSGGSPTGTIPITSNGTYDVTNYASAAVNVSGGEPSLPSEYQEVEYIECYGNQYIVDSSAAPRTGDILDSYASLDSSVSSSSEDGVMGGNASSTFEIYFKADKLQYYGGVSGQAVDITRDTITKIQATFTSDYSTLAIGRYTSSYKHKGKIWKTKLINGRGEVAYKIYVPCYRKSDSVIGFYELFKGIFYTNQGSDSFGKGADVN